MRAAHRMGDTPTAIKAALLNEWIIDVTHEGLETLYPAWSCAEEISGWQTDPNGFSRYAMGVCII